MEKRIEKLIKSKEFGNGCATPDAYSTAWVARIENKDKTGPEFPECVDHIRRNQLNDGSWGVKKPFLIFDRILSTLIAVNCLKQWDNKNDQESNRFHIEKGSKFIENNLVQIGNLSKIKANLTTGFELLVPTLIDDSKELGLEFGSEQIVHEYRLEKDSKMNKIQYCEEFCRNMPGFGSWYFSLEGLGSRYSDEQIEGMLSSNGLICGCYSATAFALYRGIQSEESLKQIRMVVNNQGGVPLCSPKEVFDLAWSINYLYFSGFPITKPYLETHIERLKSIWVQNKGMVSASNVMDLPPDADTISNSLLALKLSKRLPDNETKQSLMHFFEEKYSITFKAEVQPSLTTNLNCLIALGQLKRDTHLSKTTENVCQWTKSYIIKNKYSFEDKWNLSKFYVMSRALLAFKDHDSEFAEIILEKILLAQNKDGGWGGCQNSTSIETAYIIIAVSHWVRYSSVEVKDKCRQYLVNAAQYMNKAINDEVPCFWIAKTLYSLINLDKLTILCAKYALEDLKMLLTISKIHE